MPGSVVEIAWIAGSEIVTVDERTIRPKLAQQPHVRRAVLQIAAWRNFKLKRSARVGHIVSHDYPRS
jgi:hypothetical protein